MHYSYSTVNSLEVSNKELNIWSWISHTKSHKSGSTNASLKEYKQIHCIHLYSVLVSIVQYCTEAQFKYHVSWFFFLKN